ncbi:MULTISPECIES: DUF3466 family protein [Rheinheimera]|uniref:DUF3466 family protein n=1 Tax=Rheinheimera marina TaxID=1774958 RepID=A0ABV9JJ06_9GAMM
MRLSPVVLAVLSACAVSANAAVYQVQELPEITTVRSQFGNALNDNGDIVGSANYVYNQPFDLDALDLESTVVTAAFTTEEIENIKIGNINAALNSKLLSFFMNPTSYEVQRVGDVQAFDFDTGEQVKIRDQGEVPTSREYLYDINNLGNAIGMATPVYQKQDFTPAATDDDPSPETVTLWVPQNPYQQAYLLNGGSRQALPIPYAENGGGFSVAQKISGNNYIAGSGSVGMSDTVVEQIETNCTGDSAPIAICQANYAGSYTERALVWQLNSSGQIGAPVEYGFLGPEINEEGISLTYLSRALSVNNNGVAVGYSSYTDKSRDIYNQVHATVFHEGEVSPVVDPLEWISSSAVDINNENIVVGTAYKNINGTTRSKMFVFDYNTNTVKYPTGFFVSSGTMPTAVNDHGMVVGAGEVFLSDSATRRQVAFLYDIAADTFTDLNTLLPCNSTYNVVDARDINENNEIVATVVKSVEGRDSLGEVVRDSAGNPVMESVARTVLLKPVANGTVDDCSSGSDDGETYERKSGSSSWLMVLLVPLAWMRRRYF